VTPSHNPAWAASPGWMGTSPRGGAVRATATLAAQEQSTAPLEELVTQLARELGDAEITRILNMKKMHTPGGLLWTQDRVRDFRRQRHILGPGKGRAEDALTMNQLQERLGIGHSAVLALARRGAITPNQFTDFAPWRVPSAQLEPEQVQRLVAHLKHNGRLPMGGSPKSPPELFDAKEELTAKRRR